MNPTILLVDDDAVSLKLVSYLLRREGYRILQAPNAERGLELIREALPDLLLLDLQLPGMSGFELLHQLRGDERTQALRVVALTAHAMKGDSEKALALGFDGYLTKPIDTRLFAGQVKAFLPVLPGE